MYLIDAVLCQPSTEQCFFGECDGCRDELPSDILHPETNDDISGEDDACWMTWSSTLADRLDTDEDQNPATKKLMMQRVSGSVNDLIDEFDAQCSRFATHHFNTRQQIDYIKQIKLGANERRGVVIEMDFSENYHLIVQHEVQQAHYNTAQATIFTVNIRVNAQTHHSMAIISDCLKHDVKFVHAAQKIISQFVRDKYPRVRNLNYVTDDACQHFKSNKSILNLTHHHRDFGIDAGWSFSATARDKSSVDGIRASIKYRATRQTLSGDRADAVRPPPREL
jgi:hypothetical protein